MNINRLKFIVKSSFSVLLFFKFLKDYLKFSRLSLDSRFELKLKDIYPWLRDATETTDFNNHYIYHPAWAARILSKTKPEFHVDISSTLHFCSIVSAFISVKFYDYRPADLKLDNLTVGKADLLSLPFADGEIKSLSCMHTVEHVGLGRYGDPLDPDGDLKAIKELIRVLAPGGDLLFVVPVGKPKIEYNAHRIYSYDQITEYFSDLKLEEFSLIPESIESGIIPNAAKESVEQENYGCGCFWFKK